MIQKIKYTLFLLNIFRKESVMTKLYLVVRMTIFPMTFLEKIKPFFQTSTGILDIGC